MSTCVQYPDIYVIMSYFLIFEDHLNKQRSDYAQGRQGYTGCVIQNKRRHLEEESLQRDNLVDQL